MLSKRLDSAISRLPRVLRESQDTKKYTTKDVQTIYMAPKELPSGVRAILVDKVTVVWGLDIDDRDWGITGFSPDITEIYGLKEFESTDDDKKNWEEDAQWNVKDYTITFESAERSGGFMPTEVMIDESNKIIRVTFAAGLL